MELTMTFGNFYTQPLILREASLPEGTGAAVARDKVSIVLDTLARNKAVSLLELMSMLDLPDTEIEQIVNSLQSRNLVKVSGSGADKIITIREQGLRVAG